VARARWALGLIVLAGCGSAPEPAGRTATVTRVIDGDTIKAGTETVRLVGIDTPESKRPDTPVECGAKRAAAALRELVEGRSVTLERDPTQAAQDRFGRTLAYLEVDGRDAGEQMVRSGFAKVYVYGGVPFARVDAYRRAAAAARSKRAGVYGACGGDFHTFVTPS
jgi:micrococcal nuclease